jgi:predicted amidohydrolase YtcJ
MRRTGRAARRAAAGIVLWTAASAGAATESLWIGDVLTLDPERPRAGAVAVDGGRIVAVGAAGPLLDAAAPGTRIERFEGTLVPGFVDAHGHLWLTGLQALFADLLPPPDGGVTDLAGLEDALRAWAEGETVDVDGGWIVGMGYDDAFLAEGRHPTRADLDAVSTTRPVFVVHQSWHLGSLNSVALARLGIDADTPDPEGGHYRRDADGVPTGVVEELALQRVAGAVLGALDPELGVEIVRRGIDAYVANGFTTAQDGSTSAPMLAALRAAAATGDGLAIDVIAYPQIALMTGDDPPVVPSAYVGGLRLGGTKLLLDGSPQGKTAWLTAPYHVVPEGRAADYRGYPIAPDARVDAWVERAFAEGGPVLAHANGDAAADQLIGAVRAATDRHGPGDRRTVMIHAQTVREDQLDAMAGLGIVPSFFSAHTFYWGDWHRESVLGPERADRISPTRSAVDRGLRFTVHHDAPVVDPDPIRVIHATVNRRTRSGDILGPDQRVDVETALRATTEWAAWQAFEEADKGTITVGKRADFTLVSADPLATAPEDLLELRVTGTVKDGRWVHRAPAP